MPLILSRTASDGQVATAPLPHARLSRRSAVIAALSATTGLLAGRGAFAQEGPEEIGLPKPGSSSGMSGVGMHGGAGAGGGTVPNISTATANEPVVGEPPASVAMAPVTIDGRTYTAYTETVVKQGQWDLYTCEFDVAYMIMATFGVETTLDELVGYVGFDNPFDPYAEETAGGIVIYGGDIGAAFCGDLTHNTFSKTRGSAMRRAFEGFDFKAEACTSRTGVERGLSAGKLLWMKTTVDFTAYEPTRWQTPDGTVYPTAYENDHCVAAIGYDDASVVIRDSLGPTNTNWDRPWEYDVPWDVFMDRWGSSGHDGLLVSPR